MLERDADAACDHVTATAHPGRSFRADPDELVHRLRIGDRWVVRPILEAHQVAGRLAAADARDESSLRPTDLRDFGGDPRKPGAPPVRNRDWPHMVNEHVISMPDKWEYPWFAACDLAFQTIALAIADVDFAKQQLDLLLQGFYLHPTGQMPAYEWNFAH